MECKKCGFNNLDSANFCATCGTKLNEFQQSDKYSIKNLLDIFKMGALSIGVLFALIFFLMIGFDVVALNTSTVTTNLFNMLGDLFQFTISDSQRVGVNVYIYEAEIIYHILTLVIICLVIILVPLFSGIYFYKLYKKYYLKTKTSLDVFGFLSCFAYVGGAYILLNLNYMNLVDQLYIEFNGTTIAGIVLIFVFTGIYAIIEVVSYLLYREKDFKTLLNKYTNFGLIIFSIVMLSLTSRAGLELVGTSGYVKTNFNTSYGLFQTSFAGVILAFDGKYSDTFFTFANKAVLLSEITSMLNVLLIISIILSIVGFFKNLRNSKFNIFNISVYLNCVLSIIILILMIIAKDNYLSALSFFDKKASLVVETYLVITMVVLTAVSAIIILLQKLILKEKEEN